ncbi:MAG: hypothetical protein MZU84_09275 [Sphingobacterium sp.]|nr:hypothetical protein [Sphingobacterium sp.]
MSVLLSCRPGSRRRSPIYHIGPPLHTAQPGLPSAPPRGKTAAAGGGMRPRRTIHPFIDGRRRVRSPSGGSSASAPSRLGPDTSLTSIDQTWMEADMALADYEVDHHRPQVASDRRRPGSSHLRLKNDYLIAERLMRRAPPRRRSVDPADAVPTAPAGRSLE